MGRAIHGPGWPAARLQRLGACRDSASAPSEVQAQLLRALQQREIQTVGGSLRKVELRVIAATDAPLENATEFKAALLHRLGSCEIQLHPLREHPEDIGELLWHFLQNYLTEDGATHLLPSGNSSKRDIATWAELFQVFVLFNWPGNVIEIKLPIFALITEDAAKVRLLSRRSLRWKRAAPI